MVCERIDLIILVVLGGAGIDGGGVRDRRQVEGTVSATVDFEF